jgi:hypothetical protein
MFFQDYGRDSVANLELKHRAGSIAIQLFVPAARTVCSHQSQAGISRRFFDVADIRDRRSDRVDRSRRLSYTQDMSLEPLALTFALLVFWIGLGWSVIAVAEPEMQPLKALFLAPVTGVAVTVLPAFWLNILGLPVGSFARPLTVVLCCIIVAAWIWRRPAWTRCELIFIVPVVAALLLIGFPMLRFGFDWVANANDDWANYNLRAIRFLNNGFYQKPSIEAMRAGRDYPGFFWFLDVAADTRPGSDILLAWVSGLLGRNPFFVFMPLILAFHGVFSFAAAGVAMLSFRRRSALFAALVLTAIAPLSLYAVHQQLIAQVIGLAFMCATACLTFVPFRELNSVGRIALTSTIVAAYWLIYPETVPFFALAFLLFHVSHLRTKEWGWNLSWISLIPPGFACLMLGPYAFSFFFFILSQLKGSATQGIYDGVSIFPYFLIPNGLAVLFGFSRLGDLIGEPWLSLSIGAGLLLLIVVAFGTLFGLIRKRPISSYLIVILLFAAILVVQRNDFGVFKIAMFAQAFIWFAIVVALTRFRSRTSIAAYGLILSVISVTDISYLRVSLRDDPGGGNSIPDASRDHLLSRVLIETRETCDVNFETSIPPLIKILAAIPGCARSFIARPYPFDGMVGAAEKIVDTNPLHGKLGITEFARRAAPLMIRDTDLVSFPYRPLGGEPVVISKPPVEFSKTAVDGSRDSIFNEPERVDALTALALPANRLVFLNSSLGSHYYLPESGVTSIFATEKDTFFAGGKHAAIGRYLLFRVNSPAKSVRLVLDLTTSILGDGSANLPPAVVVGENAIPVGLMGHGAARVVSPPFSPLIVDGVAYVLLDLGADAKLLNVPRSGLMKLYGANVPIDPRRMVAFARQIRLIDADALGTPVLPSGLVKFPADLANLNLEFSGIYEDGWLGNEGFVVLSSGKPGKVVFRGLFSKGLGLDSVDLALTVEGGGSIRKHLEPGPFEIEIPAGAGRSRIGFHFSAIGRLPAGDSRPVVALLSSISIEAGDAKSSEPSTSVNLPKVIQRVGVQADGLFLDGWLARKSFVVVNSVQAGKAVLRGMVPGNIGLEDQKIEIANDAGDIVRMTLGAGPFEIEVPVKAGRSKLSIDFSRAVDLPKGDGRNVAALLQSMAVVPAPE